MDDKKITITTSSGFEYEVEAGALDDMEIFEDLMTIEDPDASKPARMRATTRAFRKLIGEEQTKSLEGFLRSRDGRVRISAYQKEILELFASMNNGKKK